MSASTKLRVSTKPRLNIGIVGGGISGVACAIALQKEGHVVKVFERDVSFGDRKQGYGLTLTNNKSGPLAKLGLLDECVAKDCPSYYHWFFEPNGNVLGYYGRAFLEQRYMNLSVERANLRVPRQELRKMLLRKVAPETMVWGRKIIDYTEHRDRVSVTFEKVDKLVENDMPTSTSRTPTADGSADGSADGRTNPVNPASDTETLDFDMLVGADGIRSIVRSLRDEKDVKTPTSHLKYVGASVILGTYMIEYDICVWRCIDT